LVVKSPTMTHSDRILLSDAHFHALTLSEQEIGIIVHALHVLETAFDEETEYRRLIGLIRASIADELEKPASKGPLSTRS
jgi:L-fucose mutarotase/ribose pyranase (RbsD/FucU family)